MPSISEWRQPYLLSNFDLVTESLTLIAGKSSVPVLGDLVEPVHAGGGLLGDALDALADPRPLLRVLGERALQQRRGRRGTPRSSAVDGSGTAPAFSYSAPLWTSSVASPPSSRIMFGPSPSGQVQHLLGAPPVLLAASRPSRRRPGRPAGSSGVPSGPTTTAAAAWSWVEKMLQEAQRTSAPSATSVSMRTAVWMVMCSEPVIAGARQRLRGGVLLAHRHQAGHLVLGEADLLAAELGQGEVGDLEVVLGQRGGGGHRVLGVGDEVRSGRRPPRAGARACPARSAASRSTGTSSGRWACASNQRVDGGPQLGVGAQALGEAHLAQADVEVPQQLAQRAQALQLGGAVEAVARIRARGRRRARRARCSAACAATSRSSRRPRGW